MGFLVIALDYFGWDSVTIAVDVDILIAHCEMVDHYPDLNGEVKEAERCSLLDGRSWRCRCQFQSFSLA